MDIKKLLKSFGYAFSGLKECIKTEQNMRIHLSVASLIIYFACFFGITKIEWAILLITIGLVIFAECVNTAIEALGDAITKNENKYIKVAKDISAGAVTVLAITSVVVGIGLFGDDEKIIKTLTYIFTNWCAVSFGAVIFLADLVFICKKRKGDK